MTKNSTNDILWECQQTRLQAKSKEEAVSLAQERARQLKQEGWEITSISEPQTLIGLKHDVFISHRRNKKATKLSVRLFVFKSALPIGAVIAIAASFFGVYASGILATFCAISLLWHARLVGAHAIADQAIRFGILLSLIALSPFFIVEQNSKRELAKNVLSDPEKYLVEAKGLASKRQLREAREILREIVNQVPGHSEARRELASVENSLGIDKTLALLKGDNYFKVTTAEIKSNGETLLIKFDNTKDVDILTKSAQILFAAADGLPSNVKSFEAYGFESGQDKFGNPAMVNTFGIKGDFETLRKVNREEITKINFTRLFDVKYL